MRLCIPRARDHRDRVITAGGVFAAFGVRRRGDEAFQGCIDAGGPREVVEAGRIQEIEVEFRGRYTEFQRQRSVYRPRNSRYRYFKRRPELLFGAKRASPPP